jgi:hypothetical protein
MTFPTFMPYPNGLEGFIREHVFSIYRGLKYDVIYWIAILSA